MNPIIVGMHSFLTLFDHANNSVVRQKTTGGRAVLVERSRINVGLHVETFICAEPLIYHHNHLTVAHLRLLYTWNSLPLLQQYFFAASKE